MNKEHTEHLFTKYPNLYRGRIEPLTQNLMPFGFECGDGWFKLIDELSAKIEPLGAKAIQVKEKFGTLCFYAQASDEAFEHIFAAEEESEVTCEDCGNHGARRNTGWVRTLCDECFKARVH